MGILQHHDAVAGTEKQAVANDYVFILHNAETAVQNVIFIFKNKKQRLYWKIFRFNYYSNNNTKNINLKKKSASKYR